MEDLGRNTRIEGLSDEGGYPQHETVSEPMPRSNPAAYDNTFEGDLAFDTERAAQEEAAGMPPAPAPGSAAPQYEAHVAETVDSPAEPPAQPYRPYSAEPAPFVRAPKPHKTQAAINLMSEDDAESAIDYSHESDYTTRRGSMLSGAGYRRSRMDEKRFKKDLRYGQYLEVPKGRRDLFASKAQQRTRNIMFVIIAVALIALIVLLIWLLVR